MVYHNPPCNWVGFHPYKSWDDPQSRGSWVVKQLYGQSALISPCCAVAFGPELPRWRCLVVVHGWLGNVGETNISHLKMVAPYKRRFVLESIILCYVSLDVSGE